MLSPIVTLWWCLTDMEGTTEIRSVTLTKHLKLAEQAEEGHFHQNVLFRIDDMW